MSAFSTSQLHGLIGKALLEADKQRAVALDGDSQVNVRRIHTQHVKAATWQTEIILRSIFN